MKFVPRTGLSLSAQFVIVAAIVLTLSMAVLGTLVSSLIQQSVLRTAGDEWAAFLGAFLEPHIQGLEPGEALSASQIRSLDRVFSRGRLGETLVAMKIWSTNGDLLYSTSESVGEDRHNPAEVLTAGQGFNVVQLAGHDGQHEVPLIEVYAPLHHLESRRVIAVGELNEEAGNLMREVGNNRLATWIAVGLTTILMTAALYLIVRGAASTIARQRSDLNLRVTEAAELAAQNHQLRVAADQARLDASEANEQLLARIGSDLHDGPVQLFSLVALRLSAAPAGKGSATDPQEKQVLSRIVRDALGELRNISAGLSLPEIGEMGLREALELAVFRHEDLTGSQVERAWGRLPRNASDAVKTCAYRVIQEGLTNANKHAPGAQFMVGAWSATGVLHLDITDTGASVRGMAGSNPLRQKLGIAGMRNRVTALKGRLEVVVLEPAGRQIKVELPLEPEADATPQERLHAVPR